MKILNEIITEIKKYVRGLDTPDNTVYKENNLLIMSCFSKAIEIIEAKGMDLHESNK